MKASEMQAARKAAKKEKKIEREFKKAGSFQKLDRNKASKIEKEQKSNVDSILTGTLVSEDEALTNSIKMWLSFQDMRYYCNQELINFAELIIRQVQRLGLYCNKNDEANDKSVQFACHEASDAVNKWDAKFDDLSPNQRHVLLRPLATIFSAYSDFLHEAPVLLIKEVTSYGLAVRVAKKGMRFLGLGRIINHIGNVINGSDSRNEARKLKMPYSEFSDRVLNAANLLYDIGIEEIEMLELMYGKSIKPIRPQKINDVRQPLIKMLAQNKGDVIIHAIKKAEEFIRNQDNSTGFNCFDWSEHFNKATKYVTRNIRNQFRKDLVQAEII